MTSPGNVAHAFSIAHRVGATELMGAMRDHADLSYQTIEVNVWLIYEPLHTLRYDILPTCTHMRCSHQIHFKEGRYLRQSDRSEAVPTENEHKSRLMAAGASCQCPTPAHISRMKLTTASVVALAVTVATTSAVPVKRAAPQGIDVSNYQGVVNFAAAAAKGITFAYIKATESTSASPWSFSSSYSPCTSRSLH